MRGSVAVTAALLLGVLAPSVQAKFGISKTRILLPRSSPPRIHLLGRTVSVEVTTEARRVTDRQLRVVQDRVEAALRATPDFELVAASSRPENLVRVVMDEMEARIRESITYESKYVKIGERQEWNAKKNRYETKDVYGNRQEPVTVRTVTGRLGARVQAETPGGPKSADASVTYDQQFKGNATAPPEAYSEEALERFLVEEAAQNAVAAVTFSPDPLDAMLAVDGDLKNGNRLAEAAMFEEALAEWGRRTLRGDKEAARLHNIGVAHEALAYKHPPHSDEHQSALEKAADHYRRALALDPGEKYFAEPTQRVVESLRMADDARAYRVELARYHEEGDARRRAAAERTEREAAAARAAKQTTSSAGATRPPDRKRPSRPPVRDRPSRPADSDRPTRPPVARTTPTAPPPAELEQGLSASASASQPLRNGSFEASLDPWTISGRGALDAEAGRGRVLRLSAETAAAGAAQPVRILRPSSGSLGLSLEYRILEGSPRMRVLLDYEDAEARPRKASLDVLSRGAPGAWTAWSADLASVRPPLSRLTAIQVVVDGATVLLDTVAVTSR